MPYEIEQSERAFSGRVFDVLRQTVRTPEGATMNVDVVKHNGAVAIIAIDEHRNLLLVHQYRHPAGKALLELPAGTLEGDEQPEDCARRESREEIGYEPGELVHLGAGYLAPGYSTERIHFFLARQLTAAPLPQDKDEDIQLRRVPLAEARAMVKAGRFEDVKTIAGLSLADGFLAGQNA